MCVSLLWGAFQVGAFGCNMATAIETSNVVAISHQEAWRHGEYEISLCKFHNEPKRCEREWALSGDSDPASSQFMNGIGSAFNRVLGFIFGGV